MKKVLIVLIFVFSFFSVSCNLIGDGFNASMKDFFDENLGTAQIIDVEYDPQATYYTGNDEYLNVPSNTDFSIKLLLHNPQGYKFELEKNLAIRMKDDDVNASLNIWGDPDNLMPLYEIYSDPKDRTNSTLILCFSQFFLQKWESGYDISPIITLSHPLSDVLFESYDKLQLRSNSPPPPVFDMDISAYWNENADKKEQCYQIAFTMPSREELLGIHKDISKLEIKIESENTFVSGKDWNVKIDPDGSFYFYDDPIVKELECFEYGGGDEDRSASFVRYFSDVSISSYPKIICSIALYDRNGLNSEAFSEKEYSPEQGTDIHPPSFEITLPGNEMYEFKIQTDVEVGSEEKIEVKLGGSISFDVVTKDGKPAPNGTFEISLRQNGDVLPLPTHDDDGKTIRIDEAIPLGMYEIYMSVEIDGIKLDKTLSVEIVK
ncbi:MAG: hypothetical protein HDR55_05675 [Treponema sp.]|nr:hypothetical protein [Treponema sp.]